MESLLVLASACEKSKRPIKLTVKAIQNKLRMMKVLGLALPEKKKGFFSQR